MLLVLKTHRLLPFVEGTVAVLPKLIIGEDGVLLENSAFAEYEQQDSALLAWLLSTVNLALHNQLIGSSSSVAELWEALTRVLGTQTTSKVMRSRSLLHHFKKNTLSMSVYLAEIKHLCDLLAGCGHHISLEEQQSTILNGLPLKFDHVVLIITTSRASFDLHDITMAFLDAEVRQQVQFSSFSANVAEATKIASSDLPSYFGQPPPQVFQSQ
ncbi:hypothetical protein PVK06_036088 [Gossypium arboreum]|uniref:Uncharacterized protein n=1 Tax=Gossypium arboreum TaxID=29729 RepID=A0ABR0NLP6_GOSAR|nr:hypothetical protein PVK06_036088 [Gossypium arboreum]